MAKRRTKRTHETTKRCDCRDPQKCAHPWWLRVKVRGEATIVLDGPFAEAKEMIGGFFLLTCKTREEAIAIAGECPVAKSATIEVRELGPCFE